MQGRPALCQKLEALDGAGLPCFFSWKRENVKIDKIRKELL
jgi:hypothetical protein